MYCFLHVLFYSFRLMVGLGVLFALLSVWAFVRRNKLEDSPVLLWILPFCIPLPYIANSLGWIVTEVGRQPWIVYGVMRTSESASKIATGQVGVSLAAFIAVYSVLGIACYFLIIRFAGRGPKLPTAEA